MQTPAKKPASVFHSIRVSLVSSHPGETLRAMASCMVGSAVWVTGIRVVEGKNGLFVSMPSRRNADGSYSDITFPCSKEMREEMSRAILEAFQRAQDTSSPPEPAASQVPAAA